MPNGSPENVSAGNPENHEFEHIGSDAEWWYFDGQSKEGAVFNIIFYSHLGKNKPTFSLFLHVPGEAPISIHDQVDTPFESTKEKYIAMGEHQVTKDNESLRLRSSGNRHSLDIKFTPVYKPSFVEIEQPGMGWRVEMPKATLQGQITIGKEAFDFSGSGYHDHNWFKDSKINSEMDNREVLATVLRGWQFGRFFGEKDYVYGFNGTESHLLQNGVAVPVTIETVETDEYQRFKFQYPTILKLLTPIGEITVHNQKILLANALVESGKTVKSGYLRFLSQLKINDPTTKIMNGVHEIWT
ncbi:hypothetical protein COV87_02725 [Candidatus Roizmanbacteria bacterium CG11_big_fil_rev_8_21_14_0_20_37_16]|uniref:AttH domain-containing protein n=1 Tax=Candidatus Roizmanbacteria bacterium CG11_big_fil_rev_8_21_14_0_20_37_16 TaxID=1974857 RepID=A0A2H0KJX2_9BACT|nr:MAG: hypothetical protein COV87_02725 [Candidatus Roizmanbacteria bacterium CG11_big_fil_rev_8_21_14_0_20_37_16]